MFTQKGKYRIIVAHNKGFRVLNNGDVVGAGGRLLKTWTDRKGYKEISVKISGATYKVKVHRLQAFQKYGEAMFNDELEVRHKNGNPGDNSSCNILLGTHQDNMLDIPREERVKNASHPAITLRRFSKEDILDMYRLRKEGCSLNFVGDKYNIDKGHVGQIVSGKTYKEYFLLNK